MVWRSCRCGEDRFDVREVLVQRRSGAQGRVAHGTAVRVDRGGLLVLLVPITLSVYKPLG